MANRLSEELRGDKSRRDAPAATWHDKEETQEWIMAVGMGLFEHSEGAKPASRATWANPVDHLITGIALPGRGCASLSYEGIARTKIQL